MGQVKYLGSKEVTEGEKCEVEQIAATDRARRVGLPELTYQEGGRRGDASRDED
jgi:hypothetical protein